MPIFMDRHDVSEAVTAEDIALLHQADLKIQSHFGCRALTYWFDENRKTAFCLIEAPDRNCIHKMHNKAHGQVPNSIIAVDAGIVESFLGRIEDPEKSQNTALNIINDPAFRTIMIIRLNRFPFKQNQVHLPAPLLKNHRNAILKLLPSFDGNLVKQSETDFLISFKSVSNAVHAASQIRSLFTKTNKLSKYKFGLKIALNAGVPVTEKKLIFESTIQLAERMCSALRGEIILASQVRDLYNGENPKSLSENEAVYCLTQKDEDFLNSLVDYMDANGDNTDLSVNDLSKATGYSKPQLYRKMILLTGKSPNAFINEYRLNKALQMLKRNEKNISEIAFQTGFNSPSYFSKRFQERYGHLPSTHLLKQKQQLKNLHSSTDLS